MANIFEIGAAQTRFVQTFLRSPAGQSGFVGVMEEFDTLGGETARAAFNLHEQGTRSTTDLIFIPEGP